MAPSGVAPHRAESGVNETLMCALSVIVVLNHFANLVRVAKLDRISHFVMAYGGLRGAIAFSLAVVLDRQHFQSRQLFVTTTIVVVYFTNIVLVGSRGKRD